MFCHYPFHLLLQASCDQFQQLFQQFIQIFRKSYSDNKNTTVAEINDFVLTITLEQNVYILALILFQRHQQRVMMQAH
uniref:Uncharacterized protein n=1 Tax=Salix viminalis TaxID=40686 RepID=A0A6N2N9Y4_SALVM